jgi:hypothetical protein
MRPGYSFPLVRFEAFAIPKRNKINNMMGLGVLVKTRTVIGGEVILHGPR